MCVRALKLSALQPVVGYFKNVFKISYAVMREKRKMCKLQADVEHNVSAQIFQSFPDPRLDAARLTVLLPKHAPRQSIVEATHQNLRSAKTAQHNVRA